MSATVRTSDADDGQTVEVPLGGTLEVHLGENPTNGYRWTLGPPPTCLALLGDTFAPPGVPVPGRPGGHTWRFQAAAVGTGTLELVSARPWESTPGRRFTLRVVVPTGPAD